MKLSAVIRAGLISAALSALAGCGALSALGGAAEPEAVFELRPPTDVPAATGRPRGWDVIVELPTTGGALETDRIMIRPGPFEAQYLPDVRWSEPAPVMVQTLMLRTLDGTRAFQYVGRRPLGPSGDYAIVTELIDFHAVLSSDGDGAEIVTRMIARIVREQGVNIIASGTFEAREFAPSLDDDVLIAAFDAATGRMISDFAGWTLRSLGVR